MLTPDFSVYQKKDKDELYLGHVTENGFFCILETVDLPKEQGDKLLNNISSDLTAGVRDLAEFESLIMVRIKEANLPVGFSFAGGYKKDDIFYLKTYGGGEINIRRNHQLKTLIRGNNNASGYIKTGDLFIFSTFSLTGLFGGEENLRKIVGSKKANELTENLKTEIDSPGILLPVEFNEDVNKTVESEKEPLREEQVVEEKEDKIFFGSIKKNLGHVDPGKPFDQKKKMTLIAVFLVAILLIWSVIFGYQRRTEAKIKKNIGSTKELVTQRLKEAEDVANLNIDRSLALINESKEEVKELLAKAGKKHQKEIDEISKMILDREGKILKKEEKKYEEFFDLAVDNKEASGEVLYLDGENLAILDKKGTIYILSLAKKLLKKRVSQEIKNADLPAVYQEEVLFYKTGEGIYKIGDDNKSKKVVENDKDWGKIIDFKIYNGNLYLLDQTKDEIFKYLVAETGYSSKLSYIKTGQATDLGEANSIAIDASVYIGFNDRISKYTAGEQDAFKTEFPTKDVNINKIFTSKEADKVYGWDKEGVVYIFSKDGIYEGQILSPILIKADDFVVYNKGIFVLVGQKIYRINL